MADPTEREIAKRAYKLWEEAGKPSGRDQEFFFRAVQELALEDQSPSVRKPDTP